MMTSEGKALTSGQEKRQAALLVNDLDAMFESFGTAGDRVARIEVYARELAHLPIDTVRLHITRFSAGLVPDRNNAFAPTTAEICAEIAKAAERQAEHMRRMAPRLPPPKIEPLPPRTPEEIAKADRLVEVLRGSVRPMDDGPRVPPNEWLKQYHAEREAERAIVTSQIDTKARS